MFDSCSFCRLANLLGKLFLFLSATCFLRLSLYSQFDPNRWQQFHSPALLGCACEFNKGGWRAYTY